MGRDIFLLIVDIHVTFHTLNQEIATGGIKVDINVLQLEQKLAHVAMEQKQTNKL